MSIKPQADFYKKCVCDFKLENHHFSDDILEGFSAFTSLLRNIYKDYRLFETSKKDKVKTKIGITEDDLENYHNLTETVDCLYKMTALGTLQREGETPYLNIDKPLLKSQFKKQASFALSVLEKHSFYFVFYKNGKEVKDYRSCNSFSMYYENSNMLITAMKLLADTSNGLAFYLADYESIFTQTPVSPRKQCILNLLGDYAYLWLKFIDAAEELGLSVDLNINPYVFPNWTAKILKGKKTICTFHINCDKLFIRLPLTFDIAKDLILRRNMLPDSINHCLSKWGCVGCGKCYDQSNIEIVEGIPLCTLKYSNFITEDSRILSFAISNESELNIIKKIIASILQPNSIQPQ